MLRISWLFCIFRYGAGGGGNAAPLRDRAEVFKLANGHGNAPPDKLY